MKSTTLFVLVAIGFASSAASQTSSAGRPKRPPKPGVSDTSLIRPVETIEPSERFEVEGVPDWLTVGSNAIWLSNRPKQTAHRLDAAANQIVATIPVGKRPCSGGVFAFESMWVPDCEEQNLYRIREADNTVVAVIPVGPAASEGGITASKDSIWILSDPAGELSRVDPDTNQVVAAITTPPGCFDAAFGFGAVWVTCTEVDLVLRVDPSSNLIKERIAVGDGPRFLAAGESAVWVLNEGDGTLNRIDPQSNKVAATIDAGLPGGGDVATGEGAVWISAFEFPLTRIDPETNKVTHQWKGEGGDAVRAAFGSIWLSNLRQGVIWRIDPKLF